jgi:ParB family transcriptional regulator, chromosome partitioning protein
MTKKVITTEPEENKPSAVIVAPRFSLISCDLIDDPEQPMRSELTPASVEDLVISIKQVGIIEPVVIKSVKDRYEVIAGHRRLYASRLAKIPEIPCYIVQANSEQTEMLKMHENLYRANVRPADEANYFSYLINKHKMTPIKIAQLITKSPAYVIDRLEILSYPDFLRTALDNGEINLSVASEFAKFPDLKQMSSAVFYAKRSGMTAEMARKWVQEFKRSRENPGLQNAPGNEHVPENQPIEHTATCVYCGQPVKLIEAEIVYMHNNCLHIVTTATSETVSPS